MQQRVSLLLLSILPTLGLLACDAKADDPTQTTKGAAVVATPASDASTAGMSAPAKQWVEGVRRVLPAALCESAYYDACFGVARPECERSMAAHFETCLADHTDAVPSQPDVASGTEAGKVLGGCTGERFEAALVAAGRRIESAACDAERKKLLGVTP